MTARRDAAFTRAVVHAALMRRRPKAGLIFHRDRGREFLGTPFRQRLAKSGVQQSMTRGGAPDENAYMESFFHALRAELTHGRAFATVVELRQALSTESREDPEIAQRFIARTTFARASRSPAVTP